MDEQVQPPERVGPGPKKSRQFLPTSTIGRVGIGAAVLYLFFFVGPLGAVFSPVITSISDGKWFYVGTNAGLVLTVFICLLAARLNKKDKALSVLVALVLVSLSVAFAILFVLGELFLPHA